MGGPLLLQHTPALSACGSLGLRAFEQQQQGVKCSSCSISVRQSARNTIGAHRAVVHCSAYEEPGGVGGGHQRQE